MKRMLGWAAATDGLRMIYPAIARTLNSFINFIVVFSFFIRIAGGSSSTE
jgi:hypothetical protein